MKKPYCDMKEMLRILGVSRRTPLDDRSALSSHQRLVGGLPLSRKDSCTVYSLKGLFAACLDGVK